MSKFNFNKNQMNNNSYGNYENQNNKKGVLSNLKPAQKMLLVVVVMFVIMLVAYSSFVAFKKSPIMDRDAKVADENISQELLQNKTFQGLDIQDIEVESTDSITHLMANITNSSDKEFPAGMVDIVFLDSAEKEMGRVPTYIDTIASKGQIRIDTVIKKEYKAAANFKVEAQA